jgi:protein-L-isoaspartate(D-aspartate) O-methyltransferase
VVRERDRLIASLSARVRDQRVLEAMASVPRDAFVGEADRGLAWADQALGIGAGQTISQPLVVARMCEELALSGDELVLDIGTGSGYHAAVLARLARHVVSMERHAELSKRAAESLRDAGIDNVTLVVGDGTLGYPLRAPYQAINVAAAAHRRVPHALFDQLAPAGRLIVPLDGRFGRLVLYRRTEAGFEATPLERVAFVPLVADTPTGRDAS